MDDDELVHQIDALIDQHSLKAVCVAVHRRYSEHIEANRRKAGRPPIWSEYSCMLPWLYIEREHQIARRSKPKLGLKPTIEQKFTKLRGRPWVIDEGDRQFSIEKASTALRLHSKAKKLMQGDERLRKRWEKYLRDALKLSEWSLRKN